MQSKLISTPTHIQITFNLDEAKRLVRLIESGLTRWGYSSTPESAAFMSIVQEFDDKLKGYSE